MPDALTTITKLIQSPPGQLAAGGVLAGIVWKFFERVESVLKDDPKLEIAIWLLGVKVGQKLEPWPGTFAKVFDRVFGSDHFPWKCFWRSCVASSFTWAACFAATFVAIRLPSHNYRIARVYLFARMLIALFANVLPDYLSLLQTRRILKLVAGTVSSGGRIALFLVALIWSWLFAVTALEISYLGLSIFWSSEPQYWLLDWPVSLNRINLSDPFIQGLMFPAFFTSIWLWLYAGSGFLLKAARRFDIGFEWFNRKFDIEKKPLQCIGLVAGALVAVVYWAAVIVSRVVG